MKIKYKKLELIQKSNRRCRHHKDGCSDVSGIIPVDSVDCRVEIGICSRCGKAVIQIGDCMPWREFDTKVIKL